MEIDKMQAALAELRTECAIVADNYPDLRDYLMAIPDMADGLAGELVRLAADLDGLTAERDKWREMYYGQRDTVMSAVERHGEAVGEADIAEAKAVELTAALDVLAAENKRLTSERDQALAALRDMTAENGRLAGRDEEAREVCQIIDDVAVEGHDNVGEMILHFLTAVEPARAFLAGEGKP